MRNRVEQPVIRMPCRVVALLGLWAAFSAMVAAASDFEMTNQQFDSWLTSGTGVNVSPKDHLESALTVQIKQLDLICNFSDQQREKLELAGSGDVSRFMRRVDVVRRELVGKTYDQNDINEPWQRIQPLSQEWQRGVLGEESLFGRVLSGIMNDEQTETYDRLLTERWNHQFNAAVKVAIARIERSVPLTREQRQELMELFEPTPRPKSMDRQYLSYLVLYQLASAPNEELTAILDDAQMRALTHFQNQGRQMEHFLRQRGLLAEAEVDQAKVAEDE